MDENGGATHFGAAFELGRHEWFALRRLITNSRSSAFTGSFPNLFLKEISQEDGRNKNWTMQLDMEHWGSGTPQPANKFKMAELRMKFQETQ